MSTSTSSPRKLILAAAQLGPINLSTAPSTIQTRLLSLLESAASQSARLIIYPELSFSTFFPRLSYTNPQTLESFFSPPSTFTSPLSSPILGPLFARATEIKLDVCIGLAECGEAPASTATTQTANPEHAHYNTYIYYSAHTRTILQKYRKIHLPGTVEPNPQPNGTNQLEKRYFLPGDLGFESFRVPNLLHLESGTGNDPILGMMLCNDRRWPEAWRVHGLQGAELILCGYNTTAWSPEMQDALKEARVRGLRPQNGEGEEVSRADVESEALFHHRLSMQAGSYANACFSVAVAKCGVEKGTSVLCGQGEGREEEEQAEEESGEGGGSLIPGTMVVGPDGDIVAEMGREMDGQDGVLVVEIDLERCRRGKGKVFNFEKHRRVDAYGRINGQVGVVEPPSQSAME